MEEINLIIAIENSIKHAKSRITDLEQALEEAKSMRFKEGDVAFHSTYGNCVIVHVLLASYPRHDIPLGPGSNDLTGYQVTHRNGISLVKEKELMLVTEMAKTLYSKS